MAYTVLVTGANRGLGLEFVKQYATDGWRVIACCRNPDTAIALQSLAKAHTHICIIKLDVADFDAIDQVATSLKNETIDVLINNAGVYPDSSLDVINVEDWAYAFKINTMAPLKW